MALLKLSAKGGQMCSDMIVDLAIEFFLYLYRGKSGVCHSDSAVS
jgi:hypothetical protein